MNLNKHIKNIFVCVIAVFIICELLCLFVLPRVLERYFESDSFKSVAENNLPFKVEYSTLKVKYHLIPAISVSSSHIVVKDKDSGELISEVSDPSVKFMLFPLIRKVISINSIYSSDLSLNMKKNLNGNLNLKKYFNRNSDSAFKINTDSLKINISDYNIDFYDEQSDKNIILNGKPLSLSIDKSRGRIKIKTAGNIVSSKNSVDFDADFNCAFPFSISKIDKNMINGSFGLYRADLNVLLPLLNTFYDTDITDLSGYADYLVFSSKKNSDSSQYTLNAKFNDIVFDKKDWNGKIFAPGENNAAISGEIRNKFILLNTFLYNAENINVLSGGSIDFKDDKPNIDLTLDVTDSRCENIVSILPPTLVPKLKTIEKIKKYGVFGDIKGSVKFKGKLPQPDITGYVSGENIHILDKSFHKTHSGTVKLNFDKRILNLDIFIDLLRGQNAAVNGYIHMYRDGINNVSVKTTENIDFSIAQKLVLPISKVFNFQLGPVPEMDIKSGNGIIDVNIQGSPTYLAINGFSSFDNADFTYNGLYGEVENAKGRLDFKNDLITVKSKRAFVKNYPLNVEGKVIINDKLDFDISSPGAGADDVIEIINNSELLKDVKKGLGVITQASGNIDLFVNIKANIVPVPFGSPPLPPDEAFTDIKVKGYVNLFDDIAYIEGFLTPFHSVNGKINFTEEVVNLTDIKAVSGSSPLLINGKIITDIKTKIPDVDFEVTSDSVNLKDTVRFLTESYLYPSNYPDISALYEISSKHDLYFKYKAKSVDFITDKAYAVMNFIKDDTDDPLVAVSGKIVLDKSDVTVDKVRAKLFDSELFIDGIVKNIDKPLPVYNLEVISNDFNLENLNNVSSLGIIPEKALQVFKMFENYSGFSKFNFKLKDNNLSGVIDFINFSGVHIKSGLKFLLDDFSIRLSDNNLLVKNMTGLVGDMPVYADFKISDIYNNRYADGYFTSKPTDKILSLLLPEEIKKTVELLGDINLSSNFKGKIDDLSLHTILTLNPDSDIKFENADLGDTVDKREFIADISVKPDKIIADNVKYIKYITSQNNKVYPMLFATLSVIFDVAKNKEIVLSQAKIKTEKNLSAKILNVFLKTPLFGQGTFNCNLKYNYDPIMKTSKITGVADALSLDIPLFDAVIKNIRLNADNKNIDMRLFGFLSDSAVSLESSISNNFSATPDIHSLKIKADKIDNDKLLQSLAKTHNAMNNNNQIKNFDFTGMTLKNGSFDIRQLTVKSLTANNITGNFFIDENGIFTARDINIDVEKGNLSGEACYNLNTSETDLNFELNNVDANYVAETLFDAKNQIYGSAHGRLILHTKGLEYEEKINNLSGFIYFDINDGKMPRLGSLEYLLHASNIIKSGLTGLTLNSVLELLNLVKSGYFSNINGSCLIENGVAQNLEIYSTGENLSMYIHGSYDISQTQADLEILGKLSKNIQTILGVFGNTSLNTFFKLIPGISLLDFGRKNFIEDVEKIPPFTNGNYDSRLFRATVNGDPNETSSVQSFKWIKQ